MSPEPQLQRPELKERTIEGVCKTCSRPITVIVGNLDEETIIAKLSQPMFGLGCRSWHRQAATPIDQYDWNLNVSEKTLEEIGQINSKPGQATTSASS